jgi:hypothetical protein
LLAPPQRRAFAEYIVDQKDFKFWFHNLIQSIEKSVAFWLLIDLEDGAARKVSMCSAVSSFKQFEALSGTDPFLLRLLGDFLARHRREVHNFQREARELALSRAGGGNQASAMLKDDFGRTDAVAIRRVHVGHDAAQRFQRGQAPRARETFQLFAVNRFVGHQYLPRGRIGEEPLSASGVLHDLVVLACISARSSSTLALT